MKPFGAGLVGVALLLVYPLLGFPESMLRGLTDTLDVATLPFV